MAEKNKISPIIAVLGAGFTISLTLSPIVNAADNPFEAKTLRAGYMVADGHEGKCGEGKCGDKKTSEEMKDKKKDSEGKCGEGKCGEGKCGDKKT
tara:strand:- start:48 stop:332 length:285 start_codon:yes stop_codon:yes gene_type:complete